MFRRIQATIGTLWCSVMHESVMWPVHGHYECRACGRRYAAFTSDSLAALPRETRVPAAARPVVSASLSRA